MDYFGNILWCIESFSCMFADIMDGIEIRENIKKTNRDIHSINKADSEGIIVLIIRFGTFIGKKA